MSGKKEPKKVIVEEEVIPILKKMVEGDEFDEFDVLVRISMVEGALILLPEVISSDDDVDLIDQDIPIIIDGVLLEKHGDITLKHAPKNKCVCKKGECYGACKINIEWFEIEEED